ncbi:S9 family peptidase [Gulosibacter sp. 10]|uniref:alpha/beta hydrolase family protein n=1 Tax=Gulosibacter sp. 10 TaxID=1255570 RepID=UPI00097F5A90|nr:alpha/beta hydrolase fold domain-containing protein [Gulosibacter sp. 10]SJM65831.1 Secreted protein [Gulosibacter sp. 10]
MNGIRGLAGCVRSAAAAVAGFGAVGGGAVLGFGYALARTVVSARPRRNEGVRVLALYPDPDRAGEGSIELQRTVESEPAGRYTFQWAGGAGVAILGETVTATAYSVTRRYRGERGAPLLGVDAVKVRSAPQRDVRDLGMPFEEAEIETELGPAPAWFVPAPEPLPGHWAVHVHGRGASRAEPLRTVPLAAERGWHSLVVSYRNDPEAPTAPGLRYGLGLTEWRDVDAAIAWAVARGARRIVLAGWSMGGTIVGQTYLRSRYAPLVAGLMLESPAVDWRAVIEAQQIVGMLPVASKRVGRWLLRARPGLAVMGLREPIDLDEVDLVARAQELEVPVLLLHSAGDTVVPVGPSRTLARLREDIVQYEEFSGARHVRLWNREPHRWERVVGDWFGERASRAIAEVGGGASVDEPRQPGSRRARSR